MNKPSSLEKKYKLSTYLTIASVFILSLALTIGLYLFIKDNVNKQLSSRFQNQTEQITSFIQHRMDLYSTVIFGEQGLFAASQKVEANEWKTYASELNLPQNYAGISGISYIQRVLKSEVVKYPYTIFPASDKSEYYPSTFSFSVVSATPNYGFDLSSETKRWQALQSARDTDKPVASAVVLGITTGIPTFSIYAPVYKNGSPRDTVEERQKNIIGFVSAGFRVERLFDGLTSDIVFDKNIDLEIHDASTSDDISTNNLLYDTNTANNSIKSNLTLFTKVMVGGRIWTLYFKALPGYEVSLIDLYSPYAVLGAGIFLSILLAWLFYSYARSRERAIKLAEDITKDLEESKKKTEEYSKTLEIDIEKRKDFDRKLKERSDEMERLNALMVGREIKMTELKQEIERLRQK